MSAIRLDNHTKELLFQTIELLRKEAQPKFFRLEGRRRLALFRAGLYQG